MTAASTVVLLADAGPLITLAYADALDLLRKPGWSVEMVDMVLHEVTRNQTPTSARIGQWVDEHRIPVIGTKIYRHYAKAIATTPSIRKSNLGELAIQEAMNDFSLSSGKTGVFLFEDHKIARASFLVPDNCRKVSTRAFLLFLEERGLIESAAEIERRAILAGRSFSQLRFPPK
jgi:hypothetical protein